MKHFIILIIICFLTLSCRDDRFDQIDFLTYSYRLFESNNPEFEKEWKIMCPFYLNVDNSYNCQIIRGRLISDSSTIYFDTKNDPRLKQIVDEILIKSNDFKEDEDFRPQKPALYDGSDLIIRITQNSKIKVIHSWQDQKTSVVFEQLYYYCRDIAEKGSKVNKNELNEKRRNEFIRFAIKSDSVLQRLPQPSPRDFKPEYVPPIIIK